MKKCIVFYIFICISFTIRAQVGALNQAIKHYKAHNLGLAVKEIDRAAKSTFTDQKSISEVMYHYFIIKSELYASESALKKDKSALISLKNAYTSCENNDTEKLYTSDLKTRVKTIRDALLIIAKEELAEENAIAYFNSMEYAASFSELIDEGAFHFYEQMADTGYSLQHDLIGIKYNFKMIDVGFKTEKAYAQSLLALCRLKQNERATELLAKAKDAHPSSLAFTSAEARLLLAENMTFSALEKTKNAIESGCNDHEVYYLNGIIHDQLNEHAEALASFQKVLEIDPNHVQTHIALGKHYYKFSAKNEYLAKARAHFEAALKLDENIIEEESYLGEIVQELQDQLSQKSLLSKAQN